MLRCVTTCTALLEHDTGLEFKVPQCNRGVLASDRERMQGLTSLPRGLGCSVEMGNLPWSGKVAGEMEEEKEMWRESSGERTVGYQGMTKDPRYDQALLGSQM